MKHDDTEVKTEIVNAVIDRAELEFYNDVLCLVVGVDYDGSIHQGMGAIVLDQFDKTFNERVGTAVGLESILVLMRTVDVEKFSDLKGKPVRVLREVGWNGTIKAIGNYLKEKWYSPNDLRDMFSVKETEDD